MATFGLRQAAQQVGASKSTILRAIQSGRLSADRTDDGGYAINAAELFRVYPPKSDTSADRSAECPEGQDAPLARSLDAIDLRIRNAALEAQINAFRTILENEKERTAELKAQRDRWASQAERLALAPPASPSVEKKAGGWWPWKRSA